MVKDESAAAPVSEETIDQLDQVKKGKARKFAMICKGASIVSLVVYKKGTVEKYKKEAKQAGKGQFYYGVVDGKGQVIRFALARADGFDSAPVKTTSLKSFLDESAELKCKPYFEIVDTMPLVFDDEDPLAARFLILQEPALQACDSHPEHAAAINTLCAQIGSHLDQEQPDQATAKLTELESLLGGLLGAAPVSSPPPPSPPPPPTSPNAALEAKLVEALKKLKPLLDNALILHPNHKPELMAAVTQVRDEIKHQQYAQAQTDVIALAKRLQSLVAAAPTSSPSIPAQGSADVLQWKEKLAAWGPAIKTAIAAKGPASGDMMKLLAQANALSKPGGDMAQALAKLTECHALALAGASTGDFAALFAERLKSLLPSIKSAIGTPAGDEAKLKASEAGVFARKKDYVQANALLDQAKLALNPSRSTTAPEGETAEQAASPPPPDVSAQPAPAAAKKVGDKVAYAQLRLAWDAATKRVHADLQKLENAILDSFRTVPAYAQIQAKVRKLDTILAHFEENLGDILDDALNAGDEASRGQHHERAAAVVERYLAYVNGDPFIRDVETNPFVPVAVRKTLSDTLGLLAKKLKG